jgi:hypothetical protein
MGVCDAVFGFQFSVFSFSWPLAAAAFYFFLGASRFKMAAMTTTTKPNANTEKIPNTMNANKMLIGVRKDSLKTEHRKPKTLFHVLSRNKPPGVVPAVRPRLLQAACGLCRREIGNCGARAAYTALAAINSTS